MKIVRWFVRRPSQLSSLLIEQIFLLVSWQSLLIKVEDSINIKIREKVRFIELKDDVYTRVRESRQICVCRNKMNILLEEQTCAIQKERNKKNIDAWFSYRQWREREREENTRRFWCEVNNIWQNVRDVRDGGLIFIHKFMELLLGIEFFISWRRMFHGIEILRSWWSTGSW